MAATAASDAEALLESNLFPMNVVLSFLPVRDAFSLRCASPRLRNRVNELLESLVFSVGDEIPKERLDICARLMQRMPSLTTLIVRAPL